MHEAHTVDGRPTGDGWWVARTDALAWSQVPGGGTWCVFEGAGAPSATLGIGIHVLGPGESSGMYHREDQQEGFLVLSGRCTLIVEGQERTMDPWDHFHCPPGTAHMTVGAGPGPCALLMVGTRGVDGATEYLPDPVAAAHGVAVAERTTSSAQAYAERPPIVPAPAAWPPSPSPSPLR